MLENFTRFIELVKEMDSRLGIKKLIIYTLYFLLLVSFTNWKDILYNFEDLLNIKLESRHSQLLEKRSEIEKEVSNKLTDLRIKLNADRVMLFEYHNTVSNLAGVPFRFMTMTQMKLGYDIPAIDHEKYISINTGIISDFTDYLDKYSYLEIVDMEEFRRQFPTMGKLISSDKSKYASFVYLNGINKPLGFILLEWVSSEFTPNWKAVEKESRKTAQQINASISGK